MSVVCGLAFGCALATAAQAQTPLSRAAATPASTRFVAIGCISRAAGAAPQFLITDSRGGKPSVYRLDGDPKMLQLHIGHTVEIAGPLSAGPRGAGPNGTAPVLKVGSLTYIARTCQSKGV